MKIVSSFFRFLLVLTGSLLLTIGILIVNACRSAVRSVSAHAAPQAQTQSDIKSAGTTSSKPNEVILNLKDGTKITGEVAAGSVELQTANGRIIVLLTDLKRLQFDHSNGTATAVMTGGDIFTGKFVQKTFDVVTGTGKVLVNTDRIGFITKPAPVVKPGTETIDELLIALASKDPKENQRGADGLVAIGQKAVPKLIDVLQHSSISPHHERIVQVLATLGWYVTRDSKVEKMSESREFQEMMRKRLPEMQAE
jgi:hypothetical protein